MYLSYFTLVKIGQVPVLVVGWTVDVVVVQSIHIFRKDGIFT